MRQRPLLPVWIGLMLAIWIMRTAGVPVFGEPKLDAAQKERIATSVPLTFEGTVAERREREESTQYILKQVTTRGDRPVHFSRLQLNTETQTDIPLGARIRVTGDVSRIEPAGNPGQFDPQKYYGDRGIYYRVWSNWITLPGAEVGLQEMLARLRARLVQALRRNMPKRAAAVLSGMLLGDRSFLEEETTRNYQVGGLFHLIAISGMHISLLGMGLLKGLLLLRARPVVAAVISAAVMFLYCVMIGSPISAVRACIMFFVALAGRATKRSYDLWSSLSFAGIVLLLWNPGNLFLAAYQLSFAAVVGTGYVGPVLEQLVCEKKPNRYVLRYVLRPALTYLAVTLTTLPMIAYHYCEVPLLGLICNLLVVPSIGLILGIGAAGSALSLVFPVLGRGLLWPVGGLLTLFESGLRLVRGIPFATWICGRPALWQLYVYYLLLVVALLLLGKGRVHLRRLRIAVCLACAVLFLFVHHLPQVQTAKAGGCPVTLTAIDVGQGDALVLRRIGGVTCLIDGGSSSQKQPGTYCILPYLKSEGIGRIDAIFLSHPDLDHMNGIEEILCAVRDRTTAVRIGALLMPAWMQQDEKGEALEALARSAGVTVRYISEGDSFQSGALEIEVLYPPAGEDGADLSGNAGSTVLHVRYGRFDALLTGDLEGEGEDVVTEQISKIECLKVAHHGSGNSTYRPFLEACQPDIALISAGKNNVYGHPSEETLRRLQDAGARILQTAQSGAITVATDGKAIRVSCYRG